MSSGPLTLGPMRGCDARERAPALGMRVHRRRRVARHMEWSLACGQSQWGRERRVTWRSLRRAQLSRLSDRIDQRFRRKRLAKMGNAADVRGRLAGGVAVVGADEYRRQRNAALGQIAPQLNSGHAPHVDVQHEAERAAKIRAVIEILGRCEQFGVELVRGQQALDRLEDGRIVIHHAYDVSAHDLRHLPSRRSSASMQHWVTLIRGISGASYWP